MKAAGSPLPTTGRGGDEDFGYANLAVRGRKLDDVVGRQLDDALRLDPDLVSVVGGGNDILRPRADVDALAARLERAVATLRATGADVLMVTPVDPKGAPVIRHTRGRVATYTAHIHSIARRHGAYVVDQWGMTALQDWRMWAEDRLHLTGEGHRRGGAARLQRPRPHPGGGRTGRNRCRPPRRSPAATRSGATSSGRATTSARGWCGDCAAGRRATWSSPSGPSWARCGSPTDPALPARPRRVSASTPLPRQASACGRVDRAPRRGRYGALRRGLT